MTDNHRYELMRSDDCGLSYNKHSSGDDKNALLVMGNEMDAEAFRWVIIDKEAPEDRNITSFCRIFANMILAILSPLTPEDSDEPKVLVTGDVYMEKAFNQVKSVVDMVDEVVEDAIKDGNSLFKADRTNN